jgi:hypothetical protein
VFNSLPFQQKSVPQVLQAPEGLSVEALHDEILTPRQLRQLWEWVNPLPSKLC